MGATGRLGVALTARLEELGAEVFPLVTPGYSVKPVRVSWEAKTPPLGYDEADIEKLKADYVINLHWRVNRDLSFTEQLLYEINFNIHKLNKLWEALKRHDNIKNFVNISSLKIFGRLNNLISASAEPRPDVPYGIAKLAAEKVFDCYFSLRFPVTHVRLCSVASFGEHPSHLMSRLFISAFFGERIKINAGELSHLLFIDEAVDLIISSAVKGEGLKYNITSEGVLNEVIAKMFEEISGRKLNAEFVNFNSNNKKSIFISDIDKLKQDWVRGFTMKDLIEKVVALKEHVSLL